MIRKVILLFLPVKVFPSDEPHFSNKLVNKFHVELTFKRARKKVAGCDSAYEA